MGGVCWLSFYCGVVGERHPQTIFQLTWVPRWLEGRSRGWKTTFDKNWPLSRAPAPHSASGLWAGAGGGEDVLGPKPWPICNSPDGPGEQPCGISWGRAASHRVQMRWSNQTCLQEPTGKWNQVSLGKELRVSLAQSHAAGIPEQMSRYQHRSPFPRLWTLGIPKAHLTQHQTWSKSVHLTAGGSPSPGLPLFSEVTLAGSGGDASHTFVSGTRPPVWTDPSPAGTVWNILWFIFLNLLLRFIYF